MSANHEKKEQKLGQQELH